MTIVIEGRGPHIKQCEKQLYKLVEVLKVLDLTDEPRVDKEVALIRVSARSMERAEVVGIARAFAAEVVDVAQDSVIVEITASPYTIDRFLEITSDFGILELTRTGVVSMARRGNGET